MDVNDFIDLSYAIARLMLLVCHGNRHEVYIDFRKSAPTVETMSLVVSLIALKHSPRRFFLPLAYRRVFANIRRVNRRLPESPALLDELTRALAIRLTTNSPKTLASDYL